MAKLNNPVLWNGDHLFVSEPVFEHGGELRRFDSALPDSWLTQYAFAKTDPFIDKRDPDGDLFSNLEEWQGTTDPSDSGSHPPAIAKVSLVSMIESDLKLIFRGQVDSNTWQIDLESTAAFRSQNYLATIGGKFGPNDRFRLDDYEENLETDDQGIPQDNSKVTISYVEAGRAARGVISLAQGTAWEMPSHLA